MWALAGMAGAAVGVGVGEICGALFGGSSIIGAVGALVISLQPPGGKDLMVALFGTNDKLALETATAIGGVLVGGIFGLLAKRSMNLAMVGFLVFGALAFVLILRDPLAGPLPALITVGPAVVAAIVTLTTLADIIRRESAVVAAPAVRVAPPAAPALARRNFLIVGGAFVVFGGVLTVVSRLFGSTDTTASPPAAIPSPGQTAPPVPAGADLGIDGLTPIVVPNADFYRIDTRLDTPRVSAETWKLRIHGMVDNEVTLSYQDLLALPLVEHYVTIACVSNEVGGHLVGNAKWTGTPLAPLLQRAGLHPDATQVVGRSFDGWTCGFPTAHLSGAGADAMVVIEMNGEVLPLQHGFPARLIVPGLFGYVSATKWLTEIELTTLEAFDAYWVPLGWSKQGPILTQSRIDVPRAGSVVAAGSVLVAGVAWAPTRGITKVEVGLDDGGWQQAELSVPIANTTWLQWQVSVSVPPGTHQLQVRATDGTGVTQTAQRTAPAPSGAHGWHTITIAAS
jgi:DMSO/TMAO reductase YedYZ molybdopterin-dependent catalytic subunit